MANLNKTAGWLFFAAGALYVMAIAANILYALARLDANLLDGDLWLKAVVCCLAFDRLTNS